MKASYNTAKEIAELYINSGLKDRTDVSALINESAKQLMQKVGKEESMNIHPHNNRTYSIDLFDTEPGRIPRQFLKIQSNENK